MKLRLLSRLFLVLAVACFQVSGLFAQGFQKFYPTTQPSNFPRSFGSKLLKSPDGGFLLIGASAHVAAQLERSPRVVKIDQDGAVQWEYLFPSLTVNSVASGGLTLDDGTFLVAGWSQANPVQGMDSIFLSKIDGSGQVIWLKKYPNITGSASAGSNYNQIDILPLSGGGWYLAWNNYDGNVAASRLDMNGDVVWSNFYGSVDFMVFHRFCTKLGQGEQLYVTAQDPNLSGGLLHLIIGTDGSQVSTSLTATNQNNADVTAIGWLADGNVIAGAWNFSPGKTQFLVEKRTIGGAPIWATVAFEAKLVGWGWDGSVTEADNGDILVSCNYVPDGFPDEYGVPVVCLGADGQLKWVKYFNPIQENINYFAYSVVSTPDGGMAALNSRKLDPSNPATLSMFFVKSDSTGRVLPATIVGRVMKDLDGNCADSPVEPALKNLPVIATNPAGQHFYATSDSVGHYRMDVDTGSYLVAVLPPSSLWQPCQNDVPASLPAVNDIATVDFPLQAVSICPQLEVMMSTNRLRPCFSNIWTLNYCNIGTITSTDGYIIVTLDSLITPISASVPMTILPNNQVQLEIPDLESLECAAVTLTTVTSCDAILGQMLCAEAHIYPDTVCGDSLTNAPVLKASGKCVGNGLVKFTIKNIGNSPTTEPTGYIVIEEDMIQLQSQGDVPILLAGQSTDVFVQSDGSTMRIELAPTVGGQLWSSPSAIVEGCGNNPVFGFGAMFEPDDDANFIDIECLEVVNSYDPNEKTAYPKGARAEHFLEKNTDIEYNINFQNTGNDTAYLVVIRDTLDAALDPASIRMGAASHPYLWELLGQGVLKITFANINLVDSNHNEAASHGFVQFRIAQKKDLADGTLIQNTGAIYFDNNAPVITNTVFHNIGKPFTMATFDQPEAVGTCTVMPNPFLDFAVIELKNAPKGPKNFTLTDAMGKVLQATVFEGNQFSVQAGRLPVGAYFFQINNREGYFVSGKLVKQ